MDKSNKTSKFLATTSTTPSCNIHEVVKLMGDRPYLSRPDESGVILLELNLYPLEAPYLGEGVAQPALCFAELMPQVHRRLVNGRLDHSFDAAAPRHVRRRDLDTIVGRVLLHIVDGVVAVITRFLFDPQTRRLQTIAGDVFRPEVLYWLRLDNLRKSVALILESKSE